MNEHIKKQWVEALRSDKYKQGTGALRDEGNNFCCLGVLCDVAVKTGQAHWIKREVSTFGLGSRTVGLLEDGWQLMDYTGARDFGSLTKGVMEWAGLSDSNPSIGARDAIAWNDDTKLPFNLIADLIEEHL